MIRIQDEAQGKWPSILRALGVDAKYLTNKHGPCPICQDGRDRFRFDDKGGRGTFFCSHCGSGSGVDLVMKLCHLEFRPACDEIRKHLGTATVTPIRKGRAVETVKDEMRDIWKRSKPLDEVRATGLWWMRRAGQVPDCPDLRGRESLELYGSGSYPAMIALVRSATGDVVNMHRTYLTDRGEKAPVGDPRRVMDLDLPAGCAVQLAPPEAEMGVAEGIETAVAASILHAGMPVWALLNTTNMRTWKPPEIVRKVHIFGDNDPKAGGQAATWHLAHKLLCLKLGVVVHIAGMAPVELPAMNWLDWNDVLMSKRSAAEGVAA